MEFINTIKQYLQRLRINALKSKETKFLIDERLTNPRHGITENTTKKEKNGILIAGTKGKFFIKSLQVSHNITYITPTFLYTSITPTPHMLYRSYF